MSDTPEYHPDGMYVLKNPVKLPEVLDLLIVGGGPAGTACAFRAKELGLSALVIDYDDMMKRIRDYAKDKLILPDFGGGDKMKFPKGDALVALLAFSPIDKDEMCVQWKSFYRENNIPAQIGIELTGIERQPDGVRVVKTWNHNTKAEQPYRAKHVAIGIGRGVPRRFDIPGNTDGIAYRLSDAQMYVGEPAMVVGGGTSAAEAVIEISKAKIKANDPSAVYWSYRGDKLPKVSKALADVFFEAYLGNGNIRYCPNSEPVGVVTADDRKDYLSLRTDRRRMPGRPGETVHFEFSKNFCIACIGEDIPEAFLNSMGIFMVTGGPTNKKRMTVTPLLETQQPNVYLIGDILSQAYLETEDFSGDPATFREIKHRGNVKSALVDGVYIAEVVAQRVAGKKDVHVELEMADEVPKAEPKRPKEIATVLTGVVESEGPPVESIQKSRAVEERESFLVRIIAGGVEEDEFPLKKNGITTIGRKECDIVFSEDTLLSEKHASVSHGPDGYSLRDDGSVNGVWYRAPEGKALEVEPGTLVRLGRQFLMFSESEGRPSFTHYDHQGKQQKSYPIEEKTIVIGREAPDITLDPNDGTMSRRHVSLVGKSGGVVLKDLKSLNGTYLKVRTARKIEHGDQFRVGQEMFRLTVKEELESDKVHAGSQPPAVVQKPREKSLPPPPPKPVQEAPRAEPAKKKGSAGALEVTFKNAGSTIVFTKGQTVCEIAEKNGVKIMAECHAGICGSDPVRILSGAENINPLGDEEQGTLEDICGVPAGECRLACMVRPTGSVEVEIISS